MRKTKPSGTGRFVIGGLHRGDFMWASKQREEACLVFYGFMLDVDGYHGRAIYGYADQIKRNHWRKVMHD
jgi:hypothetical protein